MNTAYSFTFMTGASTLFDLKLNKQRLYILHRPVEYQISFDTGTLHVRTEKGFEFDARSGPILLDWYVPNLGTLEERMAWHMHDCLAYAQSLNFSDTNYALKFVLRDLAAYTNFKSEVVRRAVSIQKSWYGMPDPKDRWYVNVDKVRTVFYAK